MAHVKTHTQAGSFHDAEQFGGGGARRVYSLGHVLNGYRYGVLGDGFPELEKRPPRLSEDLRLVQERDALIEARVHCEHADVVLPAELDRPEYVIDRRQTHTLVYAPDVDVAHRRVHLEPEVVRAGDIVYLLLDYVYCMLDLHQHLPEPEVLGYPLGRVGEPHEAERWGCDAYQDPPSGGSLGASSSMTEAMSSSETVTSMSPRA